MTDDENDGEETVILTRRDRRRSSAVADAPSASADVEPVVEPVSADSRDSSDSGDDHDTDLTAASPVDPEDALVDSEAAPVDPEDAPADSDDEVGSGAGSDAVDEATVVVDRSVGAVDAPAEAPDEATVVVDRSARAVEGAADPSGAELVDEATVVVSRPPRGLRRRRKKGADAQDDAPVDTTPAAGPVSFEAPTDAPAPEIYRPRPAPLGPSTPPVVVGAAAPTRAVDPELPSVAKQGLRWSMMTLLAFAAACAVSVVGLVALGFVVFA